MARIEELLNSYPRKRPQLSQVYQDIYTKHYKSNRDGGTSAASMAQKMEQWMHNHVAKDVKAANSSVRTLEIGAGTLNQLPYESQTHYDVIEPFKELLKDSPYIGRVDKVYDDIKDVDGEPYNRITSIAAFEHIHNLPEVVAQTAILLKKDGCLRVAIPNEGTIMWRLGWMFTTGLEFLLKYKLRYKVILEHEHINKAAEIDKILRYFYSDISCKTFGVTKYFGFYRFYNCKKPNIEKAKQYIKSQK